MVSTRAAELLSTIQSGLKPTVTHPKRALVVGAGMAGLVASYELQRAGHEITVLEARQRVGGRVLTLREPFSDGLYAEAGAMRLPTAHRLAATYIDAFGLKTMPFTGANPNALVYINGQRCLRHEVERDPTCVGLKFTTLDRSETIQRQWGEVVRNATDRMAEDESYWDELVSEYGDQSLYDFFSKRQWPAETITDFMLFEGLESVLHVAMLDLLQVEMQWLGGSMVQIVGGMDLLPNAFLPHLQSRIRFGAELVALDYTSDMVIAHCKTDAGLEHFTADFAILTLPFPALRFVDMVKPFSYAKQTAIRQLHYSDAVKIFLHCRRRFWEEDDGIFGGTTMTDLPIRGIVYPDHGRETGQGVLLASYAYHEDADRWTSLPVEERIAKAMSYVTKVHPQAREEIIGGVTIAWSEDRYAGGAFAVYAPGQAAQLYESVIAPEGPIHFAGEHASLKRLWIEGAIESGVRAAQEVHAHSLAAPTGA